jgi:hypothetical protein
MVLVGLSVSDDERAFVRLLVGNNIIGAVAGLFSVVANEGAFIGLLVGNNVVGALVRLPVGDDEGAVIRLSVGKMSSVHL